jgi:hypothetical protein
MLTIKKIEVCLSHSYHKSNIGHKSLYNEIYKNILQHWSQTLYNGPSCVEMNNKMQGKNLPHARLLKASSKVCQILLGKSCVLPTSKKRYAM